MNWLVQLILKIILPLAVDFAVKYGLPEASKWILKKLPWLSADALAQIIAAIEKAIQELIGGGIKPTSAEGRMIRKATKKRCVGIACPSDVI